MTGSPVAAVNTPEFDGGLREGPERLRHWSSL